MMICDGDIIKLGKHTIICGDSTKLQTYKDLLKENQVDLVLTSPPYNAGRMSKKPLRSCYISDTSFYVNNDIDNKTKHEYYNFCIDTLNNISQFVKKKHTILWNVAYNKKSRSDYGEIIFSKDNVFQVQDTIIWDKQSCLPFHLPTILGRRCEFIFCMSKSTRTYLTNFRDGYSNYLSISSRNSQFQNHAACFPIQLCNKLFDMFLSERSVVLDTFLGSGTSLIACELNNHICFGIEKEPEYIELTIKRYNDFINNFGNSNERTLFNTL